MPPKLAPKNACFIFADLGRPSLSHKALRCHDFNHAVANRGIKGVSKSPQRDCFRMLDDPRRNLHTPPNMRAPSVRISNGRPVLAMQTTAHICEKASRPFGDPAHVFMRDKPTGASSDHPKAA